MLVIVDTMMCCLKALCVISWFGLLRVILGGLLVSVGLSDAEPRAGQGSGD